MATYRKRNGKWQAIVRHKNIGTTSRSFHTKQAAIKWVISVEEQLEALRVSPRAGHEALVLGKVAEEMSRRLGGSEGTASRPRKYYAEFKDRVKRAELKRTMGEQVLNASDMERASHPLCSCARCVVEAGVCVSVVWVYRTQAH